MKPTETPFAASKLSTESFEAMIAEVEDYAIILLNTEGIIISWNIGAAKIKGYCAEEILGKSFKIFYLAEDLDRGLPDALLEQAVKTGKAVQEGWRVRKDGARFWGSITITAIHDSGGLITGFLKVTRDLTDKKNTDERLSNLLDELRMKNEALKREELRYQKMIFEVKEYAIILLDPDGTIADWNKGAERVKGYKSTEIIGRNFRIFYTQEDKDSGLPQRLLNEALEKGSVSHEGYRVRKDGSRFWCNVVITSLHADDGELIGFSKVTKDLTERKAAEDRVAVFMQELQRANEHLRQSEDRYHRMISEVRDYAILLLSEQGYVQNWNAGAQLIKGYNADEIIGRSFRMFYLPEDIASGIPDRLLEEARREGGAATEGWRLRKDGSKFWASVVITALHDEAGKVTGFSKVTRDLSDSKAANDRLNATSRAIQIKNHELMNLNSELTAFAYVVSHDFKEPIRKIQLFAGRQLETDKSIDEIRQFSQKIILSAKRMQRLMESLLSYSRISGEETKLEEVDLNEVLTEIASDLEILIAENNATIDAQLLPIVSGIKYQLHQMILNLISNGIKFKHPKRPPIVSISSKLVLNGDIPDELRGQHDAFHCLIFKDNGIGFDPVQKDKIFDVFRRLSPSSHVEGTGIGLSIVKKVTTNHRGTIHADGDLENGASFRVYLPVTK